MAYIDVLSDAEILALTNEQVEKIIKLKMAEEGVKIIEKPDEPEYHAIPDGNEVLFQVDGISALFSDRTVAEQALKLLQENRQSLKETNYTHDYNYQYQQEYKINYYGKPETLKINEVRTYSKDLLASIKDSISANNDIKKRYEKRKEEFNDSNSGAEGIKNEVWEKVYEVRRKQADKESAFARYNEYLALAEGNKTQAMTFYKKAYSPDEETIQYIESQLLIKDN